MKIYITKKIKEKENNIKKKKKDKQIKIKKMSYLNYVCHPAAMNAIYTYTIFI